jgi:hypothetical protein
VRNLWRILAEGPARAPTRAHAALGGKGSVAKPSGFKPEAFNLKLL